MTAIDPWTGGLEPGGRSGGDPPTSPAELQDRLAGMSPERRALLERLLIERRREAAGRKPTELPRRTGPGPWPLSHAQELMWLLDQLSPGGNAYNSPDATRLVGPLNVGALRRALDLLVARHEVLRTTYDAVDGRPVQRIQPPAPTELPVVDLAHLPPDQRHSVLDKLLQQEAERPYDLRHDPMLRPTLYRLAAEDHVLLVVIHHIAVDGWSKGVLWRELVAGYDAYLAGHEPQLAPHELQYADWAVWHRQWLDGGVLEDQLAYWRKQLEGVPPLLDLPTDRPRPAVRSGRGDRRDRLFDRETLDDLRALARAEGSTLFMAVLSALTALLGRYADADDVVVGTPLAARNRVEMEDLVGYFQNTVALRVALHGDPTFRELLRRAREASLGAFAHADVPLDRVVAEVNPPRDLSHTPLFQVMLVLQNQPRSGAAPAGLTATPYRHERSWAKFDLTVGVGERAAGMNTSWEFSTDLFEAASIERMIDAFGALVSAVVKEPDRPLSELSIVPPSDLQQVLRWEQGGPALGAGQLLPDLVADRAQVSPDAPALQVGSAQWSYAGLLAAADSLAERLHELAVEPGTPVGVCARSSGELVISLLGVLRAGGVCLPLDPAYPAERLRQLLVASAAPVVVTTSEDRARLPADGPTPLLVDDLPARCSAPATGRPRPEEPAYLLYTSGSTGQPKGVLLTHAGLANYALGAARLYGLRPGDRVLQMASPGFDISVEEIFPTLTAGACVVPRPSDLPLGGPEFVEWLERTGITVLAMATAFWHEWVGDMVARRLSPPRSLRLVAFGGEKANPAVFASWRRLAGDRIVSVNTYGPTETSVVATGHVFGGEPPPTEGVELPIGRPLPGVTVRVLDRHGRRVPPGTRGELYIGGVGLAQGYLRDPHRTAASFLPDPDGAEPRLYRTGDLGRWLPDGTLAIAGRRDAQVKIRGFRVEPGEVEAALTALPDVDESLVVVRGEPRDQRLVAYAVTRQHIHEGLAAQWLRGLAERLPEHLVPHAVVPLSALPLTPNGKVDLDRLPEPAGRLSAPTQPGDDVERRLLELWRTVLERDDIAVTDNFFDVGGHSLLAVRLAARVDKAFGTRLPLATLITAPTVADLASVLRRERPAPSWRSLVPLQPGGTRPPLFLVHGIRGQLVLFGSLVRRLGEDQPVYGLQSVGLDRAAAPLTSIPAMAAHYVSEIRSVQPHGPYLLGGFCFGGAIAVEMASQLRADGEHVALTALLHTRPYREGLDRRELLGERARRKLGEIATRGPGARVGMLAETAGHVLRRRMRASRARAVRYYLDRGRPVPWLLRDLELINRMSVGDYSTPEHAGRAVLFLADNGVRDVERKVGMWTNLAPNLDVHRIPAPGPAAGAMFAEPQVADLAAQLRKEIDEALAEPLCAP